MQSERANVAAPESACSYRVGCQWCSKRRRRRRLRAAPWAYDGVVLGGTGVGCQVV